MHDTVAFHLTRLRAATVNRLTRKDLAKWICKETTLNGRPYSFKNHEYQERIASDDSKEIVIIKSAQMGCSELSLRMAVGMVMLAPGAFSLGYVFPTSGFSSQYSKTRFGPIIAGSPLLRSSIATEDIDTAEVKTFGPGKQIYFKGASTGQSAISTTLDAIIFDEFSFMDMQVAGDYSSRIIHSPYKIKIRLSTPTFLGDPISDAYESSRRWRNMCRCSHCSHVFYPEFYEHVRIDGWNKHLDEITSDNLHKVRYETAAVYCPECGKAPSLQPEHRFWWCENPDDNHIATGYKLSPFDVPNIVTVPELITSSTDYASKSKFRQFALGMPSTDSESGLTEADLDAIGREMTGTPFNSHVMGVDLGIVSHFMVGGVGSDGKLGVVHAERVPLDRFRERYFALKLQYRVGIVVSDLQPFTDLLLSISEHDPNLFGGLFTTRQGLEIFEVKQRDSDPENALRGLRQVAINRNAALDQLLADIRGGKVWIRKSHEWELLKKHLCDMRRASATLRNGEMTSLWAKTSKGNDHYHFTLLYLSIAAQMRGLVSGHGVPNMLPRRFKLVDKYDARRGSRGFTS